jgi:amidase
MNMRVSHTNITIPVHNPYAHHYFTQAVPTPEPDLALSTDQGASIHLPSANCGNVGLKPT